MDLFTQLVERAKANKQRIVLPEGTEERTLKAADRILAEDIADLTIIGNTAEIQKLAAEWGLQHINHQRWQGRYLEGRVQTLSDHAEWKGGLQQLFGFSKHSRARQ